MSNALIFRGACLACALVFAGSTEAAVTYGVKLKGPLSVTGTIVTDGAQGALAVSDITSYDLTASAGGGFNAFTLTPSNSRIDNGGGGYGAPGLTATGKGLYFDFGSRAGNVFAIFSKGPVAPYICFGDLVDACLALPGFDAIDAGHQHEAGTVETRGNVRIAEAVPEPGTWSAMVLGIGLVGAAFRSRKSQVHAA